MGAATMTIGGQLIIRSFTNSRSKGILFDVEDYRLSTDVPAYIPPVAGVPSLAHVPDWLCWERRLHAGTCANRRQQPTNAENDEDDAHGKDCSNF